MKYVLVNPAIDPKTGNNSGFIECIGIYGSAAKAYGEAVMYLSGQAEKYCRDTGDDIDNYVITLIQELEGDTGYVLYLKNQAINMTTDCVLILFYEE